MDRRGFLKFFGAGVAGIALEQAIPLGRVWSFPSEITVAGVDLAAGPDLSAFTVRVPTSGNIFLTVEWFTAETLRMLKRNYMLGNYTAVYDRSLEQYTQKLIQADRRRRHLLPN